MKPVRHLEHHDGGRSPEPKITASAVMEAHERLLGESNMTALMAASGIGHDPVKALTLGISKDGASLILPFLDGAKVAGFSAAAGLGAFSERYKGQRATFNRQRLYTAPNRVFLCSSALDAAMVMQHTGIFDVIASSHRGPLLEEQIKQLEAVPEVVLVYPDTREAFDLARQIGPQRTLMAKLPRLSARETVAEVGVSALEEAIMGASAYRMPGVLKIEEGYAKLREKILFGEAETTFVDFSTRTMNLLGGRIGEGDLVLLMAKRKVGKTSMALEICLHNAIKQRGSLMVELEMNEESTLKRTVQMVQNVRVDEIDVDQIDEATRVVSQLPWYYWICTDLRGREMFDEWIEKLRYAVRQYGIRMVVFDHIHLLMRGCTNMESDMAYISGRFKQFALDERVAMVVLMQPKRTKDRTDFDDGKYSSALEQDADLIIVLNRDDMKAEVPDQETRIRSGIYHPLTRISALGRNAPGGIGWLMFEENYFRFRELSQQEFEDLRP